jgi:hypothetical protein
MSSVPITQDEHERPVTAAEVAEYFGMSPRWAVEKYKAGDIPGVPLPGSNRTRFFLSEVIAHWREKHSTTGGS